MISYRPTFDLLGVGVIRLEMASFAWRWRLPYALLLGIGAAATSRRRDCVRRGAVKPNYRVVLPPHTHTLRVVLCRMQLTLRATRRSPHDGSRLMHAM